MKTKAIALLILGLALGACNLQVAPPAPPTNTAAPSRLPRPTISPSATATVAPSPAPSATITMPPSPSPVPSLALTPLRSLSSGMTPSVVAPQFSCQPLVQSVVDQETYQPREHFSAAWKVRNTGTLSWYPASVIFTYVSGSKMYSYSSVPLQKAVDPGNTAVLTADLVAPRQSGQYSTTWALRQGNVYFCAVGLRIIVP